MPSQRARDAWFAVGVGCALTLAGLAIVCSIISVLLTIKAGY